MEPVQSKMVGPALLKEAAAPSLLVQRSVLPVPDSSRRVTILQTWRKASQQLLCNLQTGTNLEKISSHQNLQESKKVNSLKLSNCHCLQRVS